MQNVNRALLRVLCVALATAEASSPARAQTVPAETNGTLETILVTAQRRSERSEDVPITITNLSAEQLSRAGINSLRGIATVTPALRFDTRASFVQPTIRGVGTLLTTPGGGANVGIYVDGFYSPNPQMSSLQLLNVDSIQVLKGPQGTLFGRNTTGGAILVNTTKPSTKLSGLGEVSYGIFNSQTYQGYVTGGLTDSIAVDLGGILSEGDGRLKNIVTGSDDAGKYENSSVRAGLNIDLSDTVSALLRYQHVETDDPSGLAGNAYASDGQPLVFGAYIPGAVVATKPGDVSYDEPISFEQQADIYQLTVSADLPSATLSSYSQYRDEESLTFYTLDFVSLPLASSQIPDSSKTITQEFLLASQPGGRLQWTVGTFYYKYDEDYAPVQVALSGGPMVFSSNSYSTSESLAAYVDATYALRDNLFLTAGARYTHDEFDFAFDLPTATDVRRPRASGSKVTPRVTLRYEPTPESSVYASYSQGYKAAIITGFVNPDPIDPEILSAYEVGYKYATGRTSADLSAYYYDYQDQQVQEQRFAQVITTNAASSEIYGVEAQASFKFTDNFQANVGAGWTHGRYESFLNSPTLIPCLADSCGASRGLLLNGSTDASGFHMARSPDFTANASARYTVPMERGELNLSGNVYYTSKYYFDTSQQFVQDAYTLLNLRAEWTNRSGWLTVGIYGNNVTDEDYLSGIYQGPFGVGAMWAYPATVGAIVRMKW